MKHYKDGNYYIHAKWNKPTKFGRGKLYFKKYLSGSSRYSDGFRYQIAVYTDHYIKPHLSEPSGYCCNDCDGCYTEWLENNPPRFIEEYFGDDKVYQLEKSKWEGSYNEDIPMPDSYSLVVGSDEYNEYATTCAKSTRNMIEFILNKNN